jgi:hypothetical protein
MLSFGCFQYPEVFIPLRQTLFGAKSGEQGGVLRFNNRFLGQELLDREMEHCHGGKSNRWANAHAFFYAQLHVTASVFVHNKLG